MEKRIVKYMKKYGIITFAAFINAVGISLFLDPNQLAPGGVTGLSIIMNTLTSIQTGTWILLINIPIAILGIWKFGVPFMASTMYATIMITIFTNAIASWSALTGIKAITTDPLAAALAGSVLVAGSIGFLFRVGTTSGGADIIVKILRLKYPHLRTGILFFIMDAVIVVISGLVFGNFDRALYAGIAVVVSAYVLDVVLYGRDGAKLMYVISDAPENIAKRILQELGVGVTYLEGAGAYSGHTKKVLFLAVKNNIGPKVEAVVREEDANAFVIISSATEVFGEGYKNIFSSRL